MVMPLDQPADVLTPQGAARRCLLVLNSQSGRCAESDEQSLRAAIQDSGLVLFGGAAVQAGELHDVLHRHGAMFRRAGDRILVGGGDGTINRLLPCLVQAGVPVGILPMGTANDLARTLDLPQDPAEAIKVAVQGRVARIDLARVNGRLFANVASIGLGPKVTEQLSSELKQRLGVLSYPRAVLSAWREARPFRCTVAVEDEPGRRLHAIHIAVGNGRYYGGGASVFDDARIDDSRLDLYSLTPMPLWRLLLVAPWLRNGRHRDVKEVKTLSGSRISVLTSRPMPVSADGEILTRTPARFEVLPGALQVAVPDTWSAPQTPPRET